MSMRKLDPCDPEIANRMTHGVSTNAGGGRTGDGLARYVIMLSRLSPIMRFLCEKIFLCRHDLAFKSPVKTHFMIGYVKKRILL